MAKKDAAGKSDKVTFGKKSGGKLKKSLNKHDNREHNYRGQGR